ITNTFSPAMANDVVERAAELLPPVIPASFRRVGTVVFGTKRKQTVAWLLETTDALEIAAREISALNPDGRGPRWNPHLTVGLRLPREKVPDYMQALDKVTPTIFKELTAVQAGLWRPASQHMTVLAGSKTRVKETRCARPYMTPSSWNAYVDPIARAQCGVQAVEAYCLVPQPPRVEYRALQLQTSSQQPLTARHNM